MLWLNSSQMTHKSDKSYHVSLRDAIVIPPTHYGISVQVVSASIPLTYYNIVNQTILGAVVPDGNYSSTELAEYLLTVVPNLTGAVYSRRSLKFTFTFSTPTAVIANRVIGFVTDQSASLTHTSEIPAKLIRTKNIYVRVPDWSCENVDSFTTGRSGVFASIPLDRGMGEIQTFQNCSDTTTPIFNTTIKDFTIILCDDDHNSLDLQGSGFTIDFYLEITDKSVLEPVKHHPQMFRPRFSSAVKERDNDADNLTGRPNSAKD